MIISIQLIFVKTELCNVKDLLHRKYHWIKMRTDVISNICKYIWKLTSGRRQAIDNT